MSKEWNESNEWDVFSGNYETQMGDVVPISSEIAVQQSEHVSTVEHYDWDQEKTGAAKEKKKDNPHKKRLRKILYGIASMVMIICLGKTPAHLNSVNKLPTQSVSDMSENELNTDLDTVSVNVVDVTDDEVEFENNEVTKDAESIAVVDELSIWNHTSENWLELYCQIEEDGEWIEVPLKKQYATMASGNGPCLKNITLSEHYLAIKALTDNNQERIWIYDFVFGEKHQYNMVSYVEPDWEFAQLIIYDEYTDIYWSSDKPEIRQIGQLKFPVSVSQIVIQDPFDMYNHFYYKLGENEEWLSNWGVEATPGMLAETNIDWFTIEDTNILFKVMNDSGNEKVASFDLTKSKLENPLSFVDENGGHLLDFRLLDDGTYGMQVLFFGQ